MTEQEFRHMLVMLRLHIPYDPIPPGARNMTPEKVAQFNEVQTRLNGKIAEIYAEKVQALFKIVGVSME